MLGDAASPSPRVPLAAARPAPPTVISRVVALTTCTPRTVAEPASAPVGTKSAASTPLTLSLNTVRNTTVSAFVVALVGSERPTVCRAGCPPEGTADTSIEKLTPVTGSELFSPPSARLKMNWSSVSSPAVWRYLSRFASMSA